MVNKDRINLNNKLEKKGEESTATFKTSHSCRREKQHKRAMNASCKHPIRGNRCIACCCEKRFFTCDCTKVRSCNENNTFCTYCEMLALSSDSEESFCDDGLLDEQTSRLSNNTSFHSCQLCSDEEPNDAVVSSSDAHHESNLDDPEARSDELISTNNNPQAASPQKLDSQNGILLVQNTANTPSLLKFNELCRDLHRLRIRNQNLKHFLQDLDYPLNDRGICASVSRYYAIDYPNRSDLLTIAEDGVIKLTTQRADEVLNVEPGQLQICRRASLRAHRRFTNSDSTLGLLILFAILASHLKSIDLKSHASTVTKLVTDLYSGCKLACDFFGRATSNSVNRWTEFAFCAENRSYLFCAIGLLCALVLLLRVRKTRKVSCHKRILRSRLSWLLLGIGLHALYHLLVQSNDDVLESGDTFVLDDAKLRDSIANVDRRSSDYYSNTLDVVWIATAFAAKCFSVLWYASDVMQDAMVVRYDY